VSNAKKWIVWCPDHGGVLEDGCMYKGASASAAALAWAHDYDANDCVYDIANERVTPVVHVRPFGLDDEDSSRDRVFSLTGRMTCVYDATEKFL
jgi:hypothetical protein